MRVSVWALIGQRLELGKKNNMVAGQRLDDPAALRRGGAICGWATVGGVRSVWTPFTRECEERVDSMYIGL